MTILFVCLRHLLTIPDCLKPLRMSGKKQVSSAKTSTFVKIPSNAPNSTISNRELSKRASFAMLLICLVSGCPTRVEADNNKESELLLSRMIQNNSSLFHKAAERVGLYIFRKLTVIEAVNIRSLLCMPVCFVLYGPFSPTWVLKFCHQSPRCAWHSVC